MAVSLGPTRTEELARFRCVISSQPASSTPPPQRTVLDPARHRPQTGRSSSHFTLRDLHVRQPFLLRCCWNSWPSSAAAIGYGGKANWARGSRGLSAMLKDIQERRKDSGHGREAKSQVKYVSTEDKTDRQGERAGKRQLHPVLNAFRAQPRRGYLKPCEIDLPSFLTFSHHLLAGRNSTRSKERRVWHLASHLFGVVTDKIGIQP